MTRIDMHAHALLPGYLAGLHPAFSLPPADPDANTLNVTTNVAVAARSCELVETCRRKEESESD